MRAQLSLELMLYVSLAGLAFLFALGVVLSTITKANGNINSFETSQFVDEINTVLLSGNSASIEAYLPRGLCGSSVYGNTISTKYGNFYLVKQLVAQNGTFCPDMVYASLSFTEENGTEYLVRG